jgi:hypothetical protein
MTTAVAAKIRRVDRAIPLENGDRLDQRTFHARYEAMADVRAKLIGGIVYKSSPPKRRHGRYSVRLIRWLGEYEEATPTTEARLFTDERCVICKPVHKGGRSDQRVGEPEHEDV